MLWTFSFPVSRFKLSLSLLVIGLVSYYPTNYLLRGKWIIWYQLTCYWPVRHFWLACVKILRYPSGGVMIKHLLFCSFFIKELHILLMLIVWHIVIIHSYLYIYNFLYIFIYLSYLYISKTIILLLKETQL